MRMMVRHKAARCLAWVLASSIAIPYLGAGALAAQSDGDATQTMVLFPLEKSAGVTNAQVAPDLDTFLRDGLAASGRYRVVAYSERLPAVQRLVALQPDKKAAAAGPFSTDAPATGRAIMLANAMSADLLLVGSVSKYSFNERTGIAEVTVVVAVLDAKTRKAVYPSAEFVGVASKAPSAEGIVERDLASQAVKDTGRKIITKITGVEYREPVQAPTLVVKAKKSRQSWLPVLLLSLGIGVLLGGSGGSGGTSTPTNGGAGGPDSPPAPPPDLLH